ncbi:MAG: hypothetical protein COA79_01255 [Planctomycetota bacterium]|nr:MAG: hypothetical protein COA79_01255 [Planctomycetota bacterium]
MGKSIQKILVLVVILFLNLNLKSESIVSNKTKHNSNPILLKIPKLTFQMIEESKKGWIMKNGLDFSGAVYDPIRHKIYQFGGGHATGTFPNVVYEFDFKQLIWEGLTTSVPPSDYSAERALKDSEGKKLGGIKWKGKIYPGSRHMYGGVRIIPGTSKVILLSSMEFIGGRSQMPNRGKDYRANYQGGTGLWIFDVLKKEWIVLKNKSGMVSTYGSGAITPKKPNWAYHFGYRIKHKINLLTGESVKMPSGKLVGYPGLNYCPEDGKFYASPCTSKMPHAKLVCIFDPMKEVWLYKTPTGSLPFSYDRDMVWDSLQKVFVCFTTKGVRYYSPVENKWYDLKAENEEIGKHKALWHHHIYDPINNVHIGINPKWKTFAFKFDDKGGVLPGTGLKFN